MYVCALSHACSQLWVQRGPESSSSPQQPRWAEHSSLGSKRPLPLSRARAPLKTGRDDDEPRTASDKKKGHAQEKDGAVAESRETCWAGSAKQIRWPLE